MEKKNVLGQVTDNDVVTVGTIKVADSHTVWSDLLALAQFAGTSKLERDDAIQRIEYAIENYEMRVWHTEMLYGIIDILKIEPRC